MAGLKCTVGTAVTVSRAARGFLQVSEVISEHVRQLNVRLLERIDPSFCPLGYGCTEEAMDWMAGAPAAVQPPFGGLSSWPKHRRASWRVPFKTKFVRAAQPGWRRRERWQWR